MAKDQINTYSCCLLLFFFFPSACHSLWLLFHAFYWQRKPNLPSGSALKKWKLLSCVWLLNPIDHSVHGILQARILEWVDVPFSRGSSQPEPRSPALQANSLKAELQGKPRSVLSPLIYKLAHVSIAHSIPFPFQRCWSPDPALSIVWWWSTK